MMEIIILVMGGVLYPQYEYNTHTTITQETYIFQAQPHMDDTNLEAILLETEYKFVGLNHKPQITKTYWPNKFYVLQHKTSDKEPHPE